MFKKIVALLLAMVMVLSMTACAKTEAPKADAPVADAPAADAPAADAPAADEPAADEPVEYVDPYAELAEDYDAESEAIYYDVLGDFHAAYTVALEESNVSARYAKMAIAEAKLMEAALMLPLTSAGGNYAIGRSVPYTSPNVKWGNDVERYHNLIITGEPIVSGDREEIKAKYAETKGQGTYYEWVKTYLTEKGYTIKDSYTTTYSSDPKTWDVLATSRAADSEAIINTYDGLVEYDHEGILQPALAESWTQNDDGSVYTFKIRQGAVWTDSQGRKVADVKADDFVAGMQHMMDAMGGLEYLVGSDGCNIKNADAYISGEVTDFAEVGVKAIDDYTLEYTLEAPCSFFMTMLGYGVFAPMSREYYVAQGGKFGADFDPAAEDYLYASDVDHIAYCGPYLVTNHTPENTIVFKLSESYWNAANIQNKTITWLYNDGSDATKAYNDMKAGVIDASGLNSAALQAAKTDALPEGYVSATGATTWFDEYQYVTSNNATSYMAFYNINREAMANVADGAAASTKDELANERSKAALRNASFRRALSFACDRGAYNAQSVGEELKLASLRNCYTPGDFVSLAEEVTVDINGTATTYPVGTFYGKIMQDQIDADGIAIKVWDPTAEAGLGSSDAFDGWYNPENAKAELAVAIEELAAIGIEVSAENPIYIDVPFPSNNESYTNRANAYKQSLESVLGGAVIVNLVECVNYDEWYYTGYYTDFGYEANYDMYDLSGWGPDYGDPSTYLGTFLPDYSGYMIKCIGLY